VTELQWYLNRKIPERFECSRTFSAFHCAAQIWFINIESIIFHSTCYCRLRQWDHLHVRCLWKSHCCLFNRRDSVKAGRRQRTPLVVLWRIQVHGNQRHCRICFSSDSLVSNLSSEMEEKNDAVTMRNISILKVKSRVRQRFCYIV